MGMVSSEGKIKSAGSWLYLVAGLSAFNLVSVLASLNFQFSLGLGITALATYFSKSGGGASSAVGVVFTVLMIVLLAVLGFFACRGQVWAFVVGIAILGLDTLLLLIGLPDALLSVAFHVWAVVSLIGGLRAASRP